MSKRMRARVQRAGVEYALGTYDTADEARAAVASANRVLDAMLAKRESPQTLKETVEAFSLLLERGVLDKHTKVLKCLVDSINSRQEMLNSLASDTTYIVGNYVPSNIFDDRVASVGRFR